MQHSSATRVEMYWEVVEVEEEDHFKQDAFDNRAGARPLDNHSIMRLERAKKQQALQHPALFCTSCNTMGTLFYLTEQFIDGSGKKHKTLKTTKLNLNIMFLVC